MRKLIMWNVQTLDGYFDGPKAWELDWHDSVWGPELEALSVEQLQAAGGLIFGRVTYEGMANYWSSAKGEVADLMNAAPKTVFSRTLTETSWHNSRVATESAEAEISRLKRDAGGDLYIFGSANLSETFTRRGLIDEYRLCVAPLVMGGGSPLFKPGSERMPLRLLDARPLKSGGVILRYEPDRGDALPP